MHRRLMGTERRAFMLSLETCPHWQQLVSMWETRTEQRCDTLHLPPFLSICLGICTMPIPVVSECPSPGIFLAVCASPAGVYSSQEGSSVLGRAKPVNSDSCDRQLLPERFRERRSPKTTTARTRTERGRAMSRMFL